MSEELEARLQDAEKRARDMQNAFRVLVEAADVAGVNLLLQAQRLKERSGLEFCDLPVTTDSLRLVQKFRSILADIGTHAAQMDMPEFRVWFAKVYAPRVDEPGPDATAKV